MQIHSIVICIQNSYSHTWQQAVMLSEPPPHIHVLIIPTPERTNHCSPITYTSPGTNQTPLYDPMVILDLSELVMSDWYSYSTPSTLER